MSKLGEYILELNAFQLGVLAALLHEKLDPKKDDFYQEIFRKIIKITEQWEKLN